jgi:hypothetical protein
MQRTDAEPALSLVTRVGSVGLTLAVMWIVVTVAVIVMLFGEVRATDEHEGIRRLLHACYAAALLWYLARTGPAISRLPEVGQQILPRWRHGAWLPVVGIGLLLALNLVSDDGIDIVMLLLMLATPWCLVAWWRGIRLRAVVQGVALAVVAYLAGMPAASNGLMSESTHILLAALVAPMYVVGGLVIDRTRLGGIQLLAGRYGRAAGSVIRGALLFVPLGLVNAASGSPSGDVSWVTEWWMPLSLPWYSGIAEEAWFRLMLVGLSYLLLRPAFRQRPEVAVVAALLFSSIVFGLGHGRTLDRLLTTGLLYGLPMAAVFARRDFEHSVGAHYMINAVPWLMAFLES